MVYYLVYMDFYQIASSAGAKLSPWHWNNYPAQYFIVSNVYVRMVFYTLCFYN